MKPISCTQYLRTLVGNLIASGERAPRGNESVDLMDVPLSVRALESFAAATPI
jgi:hypothetical protein